MENITHSLVGIAMARTGLNRIAPHATTVLLLSANAPDIDMIASPWGALKYFELHRGYSHSLIALPFMAALSVLITFGVFRQRLDWLKLWLVGCAGVASHLLLDWTNSYGIRLMLPFSSRWFHADLTNLYDGVILLVLIAATLWPLLAGLVSSEIGGGATRGRGTAIAALSFYFLFECFRGLLHGQALAQMSARLYGGAAPVAVFAMPTAFNPFSWGGIVETPNAFRTLDVNVLRNVNPDRADVTDKPNVDQAISAALKTEPFRYFRYFARFPAWSEEPVTLNQGTGTRVDLTDLRFGKPGRGGFHSIAVVDEHGRILSSEFTFGR